MGKRKRAIVAGLAIAGVGAAIYGRLGVWPWFVAPEQRDVDRAWAVVGRSIDEAPAVRRDDDEGFTAFVRKTRAARSELEKLARQENERTDETLPENVHEALVALGAWAEAVGPAEEKTQPRCDFDVMTPIFLVSSLSQVALSAHPDEARVTAFLLASERLRRKGTIGEYAVGLHVLDRVLGWAERTGVMPPLLRDTRADTRELRAAVARDRYCLDGLFEGAKSSFFARSSAFGEDTVPWFARRFARPERERAMVRLALGGRLTRCEGAIEDPEAYCACLDQSPGELADMPKSVAVRETIGLVMAKGYAKTLVRYRDLRAKARP
jgi:hypothetical protein